MKTCGKILRNVAASFVLVGMLGTQCQGVGPVTKKNVGAFTDALAMTVVAFGGLAGHALLKNVKPASELKIAAIDLKLDNGVSFKENEALQAQRASLVKTRESEIDSSKLKICLGCGAVALGLSSISKVIKAFQSTKLSHFAPSKKYMVGNFLDCFSTGVAASSAAYAMTNIWQNDVCRGEKESNLQGAGKKLLCFAAVITCAKLVSQWFKSQAVRENIKKALKVWPKIQADLKVENKRLTELSKKATSALTDKELSEAKYQLNIIGFNKEISGMSK